jgi:hypothetical protein
MNVYFFVTLFPWGVQLCVADEDAAPAEKLIVASGTEIWE